MYYETDAPAVINGGNSNNDMFGSGWGGLIGLIAVAALFGWGGGGFGFGGGNGGSYLTRSDLCQDMNFNNLEGAVRGVQQGICDSTFALNNTITNGFAGVQSALCQGFYGTQTGIMQSGYETRNAINSVSAQLASCCCDLSRGQERIACDIERSTNAIVQSGAANTQRILDFLCNEKISALQSENALLTSQLSQNAQTQTILNAVNRTPTAAYVVPNPYTYNAYGYNNGCGCGCGCNN